MSEMKHTPGPWEVFTTNNDPQMLNFHSAIYGPVGDYDGLFVALANQNGNYEADANIIAAAPELLESLKGLLADIEEYQRINKLGGESNHWQVLARAAISKAENGA